MGHSERIEERLETVVEISTVNNGSRLLSPEEDHVETARKLMGPMDDRDEAKAAQRDDKEESLERSRYLNLATSKNPFRKRGALSLVELWCLGAQRLKLGVDCCPDSMFVPRATV